MERLLSNGPHLMMGNTINFYTTRMTNFFSVFYSVTAVSNAISSDETFKDCLSLIERIMANLV